MHEIHSRARGEARQEGLLAEHPLLAPAGVDRHGDGRHQLAPRPIRRGGSLARDERGEARAWRRAAHQLREQLTGVDLHPAGVAGHEVDEVEADVHGAE